MYICIGWDKKEEKYFTIFQHNHVPAWLKPYNWYSWLVYPLCFNNYSNLVLKFFYLFVPLLVFSGGELFQQQVKGKTGSSSVDSSHSVSLSLQDLSDFICRQLHVFLTALLCCPYMVLSLSLHSLQVLVIKGRIDPQNWPSNQELRQQQGEGGC